MEKTNRGLVAASADATKETGSSAKILRTLNRTATLPTLQGDAMQVAVSPHHLTDAALYGIGLTVTLTFQSPNEVPLVVGGWIRAGDAQLLGPIISRRSQQTGPLQIQLSARDMVEPPRVEIVVFECVVPLTREAINHLERQREIDKKRDVQFNAEVEVTRLNTKVSLAHLTAQSPYTVRNALPNLEGSDPDRFIVTYKWERDHSPNNADMWVLSGEGGKVFGEVIVQGFDTWTVIKASDWIQDYAPTLGIGRSIWMELPSPEHLQVSDSLKVRFAAATKALIDMEADYRRGDWPDLLEDSRAISELFRDWDALEKLLIADGYGPDAVGKIQASLAALFAFSSKFLHKLDKDKKLAPELRAYREEAELVLALSMTFVNLFARKARRHTSG